MGESLQHFFASQSSWMLAAEIVAILTVLGKSADWLVGESVVLSERSGMPKVIVGATIVSLGTTMPETAVSVVLGERPKEFTDGGEPQEEQAPEEGSGEKLGISVQTLTPEIAQQLGYRNEQGVVVSSVSPGSAADEAGLRRGDLIKEVNRMEVANAQDFRRAMSRLRSGDSAALLVRRGQNTFYVAVPIP